MLQVCHDKYVHKINSNKRKISCHSLKFSLKSILFDDVYKTLKFILIWYLWPLLDKKTWFGDNPKTSSIFESF